MLSSRTRPRLGLAWLALIAAVAFVGARVARGHEGPPFPILMDEPAAGYKVSVWADPDIGEARFFMIVETAKGEIPTEVPEMAMWIEPVSGRLDREACEVENSNMKSQLQFESQPYFDQGDFWNVGFQLTSLNGEKAELTTVVESTPPGYGLWDFAIYTFPFLFLGGFWAFMLQRRRRARQLQEAARAEPESGIAPAASAEDAACR